MVCFTSHTFNFNASNKQYWLKLLCKYYNGVGVTIKVDGTQHTGKLNEDFLSKLPEGKDYKVQTDRFWSEYASINMMPKYVQPSATDSVDGIQYLEIAKQIDSLLSHRLELGGCEVYITSHIEADSFDQVVQSLGYLQTKELTRMYVGRDMVYLCLNDRHTVSIKGTTVADDSFPIFDLDDGFLPNTFGGGKDLAIQLNEKFQVWLKKFNQTNGASWNDPVI